MVTVYIGTCIVGIPHKMFSQCEQYADICLFLIIPICLQYVNNKLYYFGNILTEGVNVYNKCFKVIKNRN